MISVREAIDRILAGVGTLPAEDVALLDARGRVLAEAVDAPLDLPFRTNSAMDGYAARTADARGASKGAPKRLRILEEIPAGRLPTRTVEAGTCARIFTGAALPAGADCVIRQEDTTREGDSVLIQDDRDAGKNIRLAGEDVKKGQRVLEPGTVLGPEQLAVLASLAKARVTVHGTPRVAIMASGDEVADLDEREAILRGDKIASSNSYGLQAMVLDAGAIPISLGIARDNLAAVTALLERGAAEADLVISTAGVSVGEHDFMHAALAALGATMDFWRVAMRPGSPLGFAPVHGKPWIGLPGNPVSSLVCFELYARPAIRKMQGHRALYRRTVKAVMAESAKTPGRLTHFLRGILTDDGGTLRATLTGPQGSGILTSMAKANALLVIPEGRDAVLPGETVDAILLGDARSFTDKVGGAF
ncbi:MAG TPA: gephyrin-like molybdotransferase Glp [Gemmatimonadales bacterium]|jgi:molybdopterin molybdotransferase